MDDENARDDEEVSDADLVDRTRAGDATAFGELWRRHYPSGMAVARSITSSIDPDDLVQESYTRIYQAIIKGGGPNGSFRAYLFTSIRNTAAAWGRSRRESAIDIIDTIPDPSTTAQADEESLDHGLTAQAFRSLPSRWQEVLWYTEIEQMKPAEVGRLMGMKSGSVSQLAFRAREGLREAWIQAHLRSAAPGSECQWTIEHLGAYSRGNLGTRDHKRLEAHLEDCARCIIVAAEARDVSQRLALVLLPLVLGVTGAAGYLATLQGSGTPIVALAAMPSTVIEGGVAAGTAGTTGAAASGATVAGVAAASASGGVVSGIGAALGTGAVALAIAGIVTVSALFSGDAGASESARIAPPPASTGPIAEATDAPVDAPKPEPTDAQTDESAPAPSPSAPSPQESTPAAPEEPPPAAAPPAAPAAPAAPQPVLPAGAPTVVSSTATCSVFRAPQWVRFDTTYRLSVKGAPHATVQPLLNQSTVNTSAAVLDATGRGTVEVRPVITEVVGNATVQLRYTIVDADGTRRDGPVGATMRLSDFATPTGTSGTSCPTP